MKAIITSFIFFLIAAVTTGPVLSQQGITVISGNITDVTNKNRVAHAAVTVKGAGIGTVSNSEGEFTIKVPAGASALQISHISYTTKVVDIQQFLSSDKNIALEPLVLQLNEVILNAGDAREIVKQAFANAKNNYSSAPGMMQAFYRESIRQRRDYISISEAVVDIFKAPWNSLQEDQVRILKGRKGMNVKKADTLNVKLQGGPSVLLYLDLIKNPQLGVGLNSYENYVYSFSTPTTIDNQLHYVIDFQPAKTAIGPLFAGKVYIQQSNLAITRIEFSLDIHDAQKAAELFIRKKPPGFLFIPTYTSYLVTYKQQDDTYYINYARVDLRFKSDWKRRLFKNNYTIISEMAITNRQQEHIEKIPAAARFKANMIMSDKVAAFNDPQFWGEHNIIEPEEAIENAIRRIIRKMK